jgi:hypothetical protein
MMSENIPAGRWLTDEEVAEEVAKCPVKWKGVTDIFRHEIPGRSDFHSYFVPGSDVTLYGLKKREREGLPVLRLRTDKTDWSKVDLRFNDEDID